MAVDRLSPSLSRDNALGSYLKERRARLDPVAFGFSSSRRRTPGLRREEVASRADVSATWYTWLEQGRGGTPSADALDRIAEALALAPIEREHLFLLAQGRPPEVHVEAATEVTPRLQRVLDSLAFSPAFVRNAAWDYVAWNRAAVAVMGDYAALPPEERNSLRRLFFDPRMRERLVDWEGGARTLVAVFRAEVARTGASARVAGLIEELLDGSPEFAAMWREGDVRTFGEGNKRLHHPIAGILELEYSAFSVDGQPDLSMVVFNPATHEDAAKVRALLEESGA